MNIQDFTTEQLKAELKARGYYTDNLWQEDDVQTAIAEYNEKAGTNIVLDSADKQEILDNTIHGDGVMSDINVQLRYSLNDYIEFNGLLESDIAEDLHDARNLDKY